MPEVATAPTPPPAIVWTAPTVNSVARALDDASCMLERLQALVNSNTIDLADLSEDFARIAGEDSSVSKRVYAIWMIYILVEEKLAEFDRLIDAITSVAFAERRTSVGKHVDIMRRRDWATARDAYIAAELAPQTEETDDELCEAAGAAFLAVLATPAPDMRAFHEKMTFVRNNRGMATESYVDALFADVERFARAEIAAAKLEG